MALIAVLAAVVLTVSGVSTYMGFRPDAERTPPSSGDDAGDDDGSDAVDGPTTTPEPSTTTSTAPTTLPVELGPIGLPLTAEDAGLPASSTAGPFELQPDQHAFCHILIDLSGIVEQQAGFVNHLDGNDSITQYAFRFESEAAAGDYLAAIVDSLVCTSANSTTIDDSQSFTSSSVLIQPVRQLGDEMLAWQSTLTFDNGFIVTQRGYMVRRLDRVVSVSYGSDEPPRLDRVPDLVALMLERLGYDA